MSVHHASASAPATGVDRASVHLLSSAAEPILETLTPNGELRRTPFERMGEGRGPDEGAFVAHVSTPQTGEWSFRVDLGEAGGSAPTYTTTLRRVWLQDGELFGYPPAPRLSPSRVERLTFTGSLSPRALYVYLPRGYDEQPARRYPVLYMHDGQNCFEAYVADGFAGSWHADEVADALIAVGQMRECIIVGVSNAQADRLAEYLPPYSHVRLPAPPLRRPLVTRLRPRVRRRLVTGRADATAAYYRDEVAPFIHAHYRTLRGRDHTATCGSSMGGLLSTYLALEHPDFARHHAAMSSAFWTTAFWTTAFRTTGQRGTLAILEQLKTLPKRDIRLWLDSGEGGSKGDGEGDSGEDDNKAVTLLVRDALIAAGYGEGELHYHLEPGALHSEAAWAARLPRVFAFLFPAVEGG